MQGTSGAPALVEPRAEPSPLNPFTSSEVSVSARSGIVSVESQRAIAEVQARMIIARANPRDPIRCMERILNACTRPTLANASTYQFARGGNDIRGPSIRLAEAIAQHWGNIASGIKEISRHGEYSECVAYAWDLESGYYDERQFQIRHWRDTKQGGYLLRDERDIYELIANFGQRRKRAVLLTVIPGDVSEAALQQCEQTMHASADTSPEGVKKLIDAFADLGVTQPQLEARLQRRLDAIRPAQVVMLRKIYLSLQDGMSDVADWFDAVVQPTTDSSGLPVTGSPETTPPRQRRTRTPRNTAGGGEGGGDQGGGGEGGDPPPPGSTPPPEPPPQPQGDPPPAASGRGRLSFE